jgi:glycine oxidase
VNHTEVDYIIVGQGLAGSCLAVQMLNRGRTFMVIDLPEENTCTVVAAGLFNPVTGQHLVKTWLGDTLFPYLHQFYSRCENEAGTKFFYPMSLYRPFGSIEEQNEWMGRSADPTYRAIIESIFTQPAFDGVRDHYGGLLLKQCGYINTALFVQCVREKVAGRGFYRHGHFDAAKLEVSTDGVFYEDIKASRVIFCEGPKVLANPWFNKLPIRVLKGETIRIKCDYRKHVILNRGVYMVPGKEEGEWRVGSTYNLTDTTMGSTLPAKQELEQKLKDLIRFPYEVTGQDWGFRPTTVDRRPILGKHPKFEQLVIFNGLGTKGVSLAPYFSEVLLHWMENSASALNKEVDVTRFKSLY